MTKIDESKQYKFSEIIAMLENSELPLNTCVTNSEGKGYIARKTAGQNFGLVQKSGMDLKIIITARDINDLWTITLPEEDKFYLKAPSCFREFEFLNYSKMDGEYFLDDANESNLCKTKFTEKQIEAMPFDTNFFEKVNVDQ
ncbi:hypothetical protein BN424_3320 [Carnobacterium maltaromaticum LMA28]|uniref:Uncharacterized protein n=1 Tax=Carnobacterium maltaromaticum LMA28 TaxID=1234679 RepID=K8EVL9_CARML|nr:hypothetical protein [Carnobacterium maltaromaticum]CCO12741.2 hypothetical protein BN424_3320 [Carnobacterium maltaromaticum LMA28]